MLLILPVLILIVIGGSKIIQIVVCIPWFPGRELLIHCHKLQTRGAIVETITFWTLASFSE